MRIALASDHAGFSLKEKLRDELREKGYDVADLGTNSDASTDYPDFAAAVSHDVVRGHADRGILVCSTGVGMSMAANKIAGIRAALAMNEEEVQLTREHNDANVLTLGAKFTSPSEALRLVEIFLNTPFSGNPRHVRRISKIAELEEKTVKT